MLPTFTKRKAFELASPTLSAGKASVFASWAPVAVLMVSR